MRLDRTSTLKVGIAGALILAGASFAMAQQPQLEGKMAEQAFKNIQVLKGIPADRVVPTMRFMRDSLGGVACTFCHAEDFSSDEKPQKLMARKMIAMELEINKSTFGGGVEVTCYTCHRGATEPKGTPVIPEEKTETAAPANQQAPALPSADQILAKYIDALGGEAALRKVSSRMETGTVDLPAAAGAPAVHGAMEFDAKAPNLNVLVLPGPNGATTMQGFDGTAAWAQDNRGRVVQASGSDLERAKRASDFYEPLNIKQEYIRMIVRGPAKVAGHATYRVDGFPKGDNPEQLYFDTQSGLLVRRIVLGSTPLGDDPVYTDYSDYRDAGDGVKVPFQIDSFTWTQKTTTHVQKVQDNVQIDGGKFNKPASKAVPAAGGQ